ncbi:MAG: RNA 2',3'-cyclic phosphodiesterase [Candidatus Omnitrophica bacterium]|nr:RNA 2',3'-cyclic phosphodiesterase [Candidatus Omnitrophota bacterium]
MVEWRCFLALELGAHYREELTSLIQGMRGALREAKWVDPASAHLTLHFFGSIDPAAVKSFSAELEPALKRLAPFDLLLKGVGCFPSETAARVLWTGIEGDLARLNRLKESVDETLRRLDLKIEDRTFKPHLTLARLRHPQAAVRALRAGSDFVTESKYRADHAVLFRSELRPTGAHYIPLRHFPFQATA